MKYGVVTWANIYVRTYSKEELSFSAILICEVAQRVTSTRLANDGSVNGALGVVDQRPFARDTSRSLEEESHGELLEAVEGVAEVREFQLGLGHHTGDNLHLGEIYERKRILHLH